MNTEEFVLILRQMYAKEQPQIFQLLSNEDDVEKAKQISLSQSISFPLPPFVAQQDLVMWNNKTDMEVNEKKTSEEKTDAIEKIKVSERILGESKYLKGSKGFKRLSTY